MGTHATVQRRASRQEALGLGIVGALDQSHELVHQVAMEPRRTEGVFRHHPAWWEDHEIEIRQAVNTGRRCQHSENRRVRVVETDRADGVETAQVVLVGDVVAVPGHDVEWRMIQLAGP